MRKVFVLILYAMLINSCGTFTPVESVKINTYQLNVSITPSQCVTKSKDVLQVNQMYALSPFNTNRIWLSTSSNELSSYGYNQWITSPSDMLTNNIIQYLASQCIYANVVSSNFVTNAQYRLNTQLIRLSLDLLDKKTVVNLIIMAQLVDNKTNSIIKSKRFSLNKYSENNPYAMVAVANQLNQQFLIDLTAWSSPH